MRLWGNMAKRKSKVPEKKLTRKEKSAANKALYRRATHMLADTRPPPAHFRDVTEADVDAVIEAIASGDTMRGKCRELGVSVHTMRDHIARDEQKSQLYARARLEQAHSLVEKSVDDLEELSNIRTDADGANVEVAIFKHKFEVRRWLAGKLHVGQYGDKVTAVIEGGETPIKTVSREMTLEEAQQAYEEERKRRGE
jgi:hypothetical protein